MAAKYKITPGFTKGTWYIVDAKCPGFGVAGTLSTHYVETRTLCAEMNRWAAEDARWERKMAKHDAAMLKLGKEISATAKRAAAYGRA